MLHLRMFEQLTKPRTIFLSRGVWLRQVIKNDESLSYIVNYRSGKPGDSIQEKSIDASTLFAKMESLTRNTNYNITVMASNQYGNGPTSVPVIVTTSNGSKFYF